MPLCSAIYRNEAIKMLMAGIGVLAGFQRGMKRPSLGRRIQISDWSYQLFFALTHRAM
jgi:hypothetical protein